MNFKAKIMKLGKESELIKEVEFSSSAGLLRQVSRLFKMEYPKLLYSNGEKHFLITPETWVAKPIARGEMFDCVFDDRNSLGIRRLAV